MSSISLFLFFPCFLCKVNLDTAREALELAPKCSIMHSGAIVDTATSADIPQGSAIRFSLGCAHAGSSEVVKEMFQPMINGLALCACTFCPEGHGWISGSYLMAAVEMELLSLENAVRIYLRIVRDIGSFEDEKDRNAKLLLGSKKCPGFDCLAWHLHYMNHGCHHIAMRSRANPNGGCTGCGRHFCYQCLYINPADDGLSWVGCANCVEQGGTFCNDLCLCPICPDCKPGQSCMYCDISKCPGCI